MLNIAVIVGSLRKESINKKLARAVAHEGRDLFVFQTVSIEDIPLYNQDLEADLPSPVQRLHADIVSAAAVLLVTPEYNRSMPGVLKNVLDWASRPYGRHSLSGKPVALMGASPGAAGTAVAQFQLRGILSMLGSRLIPQPELYITMRPNLIGPDGTFADDSTRKFLRGFLENMRDWLDKQG
ncbi:MAG: NAD(P)H-dependent oxidoreductase [Deltaproteobacteria bacterium]|jgi:chromate reductase|nr:NAD(P)H-dependent oxidoreductase [Deltaproteobacteria bacterium]